MHPKVFCAEKTASREGPSFREHSSELILTPIREADLYCPRTGPVGRSTGCRELIAQGPGQEGAARDFTLGGSHFNPQ